MKIGFDPAKRAKALRERWLDFADAEFVLGGPSHAQLDDRSD
ncbi:MAG TPA: hypothetical protein VG843_12690 [Rhizomicrobium sp.]|jgi:hypothetical protein|nr:hypothetical protein [Rhizomicrobium sp.]